MNTASLLAVAALLAFSSPRSKADDRPKCEGDKCQREVCFNLVCTYKDSRSDGYRECKAAAELAKVVRHDGAEVRDHSEHPFNGEFEVQCDDTFLFNNSSHRYTDHQGTRIQAVQGPYPAVLLPKGALRDGHRYVPSTLELPGVTLEGYCFVYTGPAL
jgi:hypothetical protein